MRGRPSELVRSHVLMMEVGRGQGGGLCEVVGKPPGELTFGTES